MYFAHSLKLGWESHDSIPILGVMVWFRKDLLLKTKISIEKLEWGALFSDTEMQ